MSNQYHTPKLGIFGLRSFVQEFRPVFKELLEDKIQVMFPQDYDWLVEFERWLVCKSLEDNFLLMVVNYDRNHRDFVEAQDKITLVRPSVDVQLRHAFRQYLQLHQMPGIISVRYDGSDVYITNLDQ